MILYRREREKYDKHIKKAKRHPDQYLSVIIDGMDQKVTSLPHFIQESKTTNGAWKLLTHVTGAIVHGRGHHAFLDLNEVPHDANITLTVLTTLLQRYSHRLPPVLYLQMDNCARDNKNRFLFAFLSLLVELGIFRKVRNYHLAISMFVMVAKVKSIITVTHRPYHNLHTVQDNRNAPTIWAI